MHASTYGILVYIYKVKKSAAASAPRPVREILERITMVSHVQKVRKSALILILMYYCIARLGVAATMVAKMLITQGCHPRRVF